MRRILCFILFISFVFSANAQMAEILPSSVSIAHTSVARTDLWSGFSNPATLIQPCRLQAALQFENKALIPELSTKLLQVAYMNKWVNVGLAFSHFGYSKYNEMLIGVVFARNFGNRFSLGIQGNFYTSYFSDETKYQSTFLPQVGLTFRATDRLVLGFQSFNPFQQKLKTDYVEKPIPSLFSLGTSYDIIPTLSWYVQIDKEVSSSFRVATGVEWQMVDLVRVKIGGYGSEYFVGCFGAGFDFYGFRLGINCEIHPILGVNTLVNIHYLL